MTTVFCGSCRSNSSDTVLKRGPKSNSRTTVHRTTVGRVTLGRKKVGEVVSTQEQEDEEKIDEKDTEKVIEDKNRELTITGSPRSETTGREDRTRRGLTRVIPVWVIRIWGSTVHTSPILEPRHSMSIHRLSHKSFRHTNPSII